MKRMMQIAVAATMALYVACQSDNDFNGELPDAEPLQLVLTEKIETDNTFALDLFRTTCSFAKTAGNVFISPLSVSMALNMTVNGAAGQTRDEMLDALRAGRYTMDEINEYSRTLRKALVEVDPSTELSIANSIWYRQGLTVKAPFTDANRKNYDAEIRETNFASPDAVKQINAWCAQNTKNKIPKIVETVPDKAMMYLINAVYFKGIWKKKFKESDTHSEDFHLADGSTRKVDMMRQTAAFNYASDENAGYLELPYGNRAFNMIVILPHEEKTTGDVTAQLDSEHWSTVMQSLAGYEVNLRMPRFRTECEYKMHDGILPDMGMTVPFTDAADFSGISDLTLCISEVIHKTFVEVNEKGTEAAAATSVSMAPTAALPMPVIDFTVDRPFLFAIREKSTGVILFMGRMENV
ncbi:MAG: serpin family protein [Tannerella sp.]|jgi:serpin B|nr:serpin family protein [Tannerella sp.]